MPHIPEFLARHPDLELDVVLDDRNVDLVQEGIDVALRMGRLADSALTARRIARCRCSQHRRISHAPANPRPPPISSRTTP